MSFISPLWVIPAMIIIAILVPLYLGSCYRTYYSTYYYIQLPIMLVLAAIPILGITGYFVNNIFFALVSLICGLITIGLVMTIASPLAPLMAITDIVAGVLALGVTLLFTGFTFKGWHSLALFCNFFTYFQVFCTGALLLELLKNGLHFSYNWWMTYFVL